jgi:hypothetical protein
MWFQSNAQDSEDTKYLKLLGQVVAYVAGSHVVALLLPGLCGRVLYCFIPLPRFFGSRDNAYVAALTQSLCNSSELRIHLSPLLQGTMEAGNDLQDPIVQKAYAVLIRHALRGMEHVLVGYAVLIVAGALVCFVGNRKAVTYTDHATEAVEAVAHRNVRDCIGGVVMLALYIALPLTVWRLASQSILPVLPAELQYTSYITAAYLFVLLVALLIAADGVWLTFQPVFLQQLWDQLYPAQGDTSYRALACEVASTVGITMVLLRSLPVSSVGSAATAL